MAHRTKELVAVQLRENCEALNSSSGLPFRELLDEARILRALERAGIEFRDRIYPPLVTLWAFLSQAVAADDPSCQGAVSRVAADRAMHGKKPCSLNTTSYCQARLRLLLSLIRELTREIGRELHHQAPPEWLWKGRRVLIADGSTVTMDDTPENQAQFPQSGNQKPGLGFPILRFVVLFSLSVGTVLDCAIGGCRGKKTGEQSLFRQMWDALEPGDVLLADRLFDCYHDIVLLKAQGVDVVLGKNVSRRCDFRRGRRLGSGDHVVVWEKPPYHASRFESREEWESLPETIDMREVRLIRRRKGYRTRTVIIVTTLLQNEHYSSRELTDLFAERWHCELDLRSIKGALGMDHLHCKTPEMVQKDLWIHLLMYNLIRARMAQAAAVHGTLPRKISFTAARQHIQNFTFHLRATCGENHHPIETELLRAIAACRVGDRPGRTEPRAVKKRNTKFPYLTITRNKARKRLPA
jgi:Transposase DDE domain